MVAANAISSSARKRDNNDHYFTFGDYYRLLLTANVAIIVHVYNALTVLWLVYKRNRDFFRTGIGCLKMF